MHRKRIALTLATAVGAAALATACSAATEPPAAGPPGPKPTVVELHGAFEDASSWAKVTRALQAEGYPVVAPAVALRGVASDTARVAAVLGGIPGPKILVGHSYGGLLVSELAGRTPGVTALVYVAAFIPRAGESAGQLNSQFSGSLIGPSTTHQVNGPDGAELFMNPASFQSVFGGDPADAAVEAAGQRPILASAFDEKVTTTAPAGIRAYAIVATGDKAIPPAAERFEAQRAGAVITEVDSPHTVPSANPQAVINVINKAASRG